MQEFKCKIADISRDFRTGQARITLTTDGNILNSVHELLDKDLNCKLKQFRKKRSLDANAYCWVLLDKLAVSLKISKTELYKGYIKNIGGNSTVVCVPDKAVEELTKGWQHNGIGWQIDTQPSKLKDCTNVTLYYGSSAYDTEQMSRLIDLIVQDCHAVGVETMTPDEIATMKAAWGNG